MKIPKRVRILGHEFEVRIVDYDEFASALTEYEDRMDDAGDDKEGGHDGHTCGLCDIQMGRIFIRTQALDQELDTFWHEVTHGILQLTGVAHILVGEDTEEMIAEAMATGLFNLEAGY